MKNLQSLVQEFNKENNLELSPMERALDLSSEIGEVQKEILIGSAYGKVEYSNTKNLEFEIGDALYALLSLANECGLDAENCIKMSLNKMVDRMS